MATMWRRAMTYLGLGPDEEYEDYDDLESAHVERPMHRAPERMAPERPTRPSTGMRRDPEGDPDVAVVGSVRRLEPQPVEPTPGIGSVRPMTRPSTPVVRAIPNIASAKPHVISPASFNDAQEVADKYKGSQPVIINLQAVDRDLSRRIIDFASGLCYGLGGSMDKVAHQVYLLTPGGVEVSAEERRRLQERGLYD
jgi:cell division inhibitor SepF